MSIHISQNAVQIWPWQMVKTRSESMQMFPCFTVSSLTWDRERHTQTDMLFLPWSGSWWVLEVQARGRLSVIWTCRRVSRPSSALSWSRLLQLSEVRYHRVWRERAQWRPVVSVRTHTQLIRICVVLLDLNASSVLSSLCFTSSSVFSFSSWFLFISHCQPGLFGPGHPSTTSCVSLWWVHVTHDVKMVTSLWEPECLSRTRLW